MIRNSLISVTLSLMSIAAGFSVFGISEYVRLQ